jgi:predicted ATPase/class 3 adenylate cyclase
MIAMLFTDVEGSTRLATRLGPRWVGVLGDHHRIISAAIAAEGGWVDGTEGDAFFATWSDPAAAARAAVASLRALRAHRWPADVGVLSVRMGLHVGYVERTDTGYVGLEVHRAARVGAAAHGGQLLLSAAARELIHDAVATESLGSHRLKDFPVPEGLFCAVVDGRGAASFPPPRAHEARPTNLPAGLPRLVGRGPELDELCSLFTVGAERLVTLTGRGGSGKTSLALVAAASLLDAHPGGVWLVSLASVASDAAVLPAVAAAVGAEGELGSASLDAIRPRLAERGLTLMLLDNLEHLSSAAAEIASLLDALPDVRVLATSQVPLRLATERVVALDALDDDAALALIDSVAARRSRAPVVTSAEDRDALLDVVRLLDGLPLALELAAARLSLMRAGQLRDRLQRSIELLREDRSDRPARQRSLMATVDWTLDLLSDESRRLFERLGSFAGAVELETLETVLDGDRVVVLDSLPELLDVDLVRRVETGDGRIRFGLPEALRQIAAHRLARAPDGERWRRAHAEHVTAVEWAAATVGVPRRTFRAAVEAAPEAQIALGWAWERDPELAARLAAAYASVLADHGRVRETREVLAPLARHPPADPEVRAYAAVAECYTYIAVAELERGIDLLEHAIALPLSSETTAWTLLMLACVRLYTGDTDRARTEHARASEIARAHSPGLLSMALMLEAQASIVTGDLDAGQALLAEAERVGLPHEIYFLDRRETLYADLEIARGHHRAGLAHLAASLEAASAAGNELQVAFDLGTLANTLAIVGDDRAAVEVEGLLQAHITELGGPGANFVNSPGGNTARLASQQRLGPEATDELLMRGRRVPAAERVERACSLAGTSAATHAVS